MLSKYSLIHPLHRLHECEVTKTLVDRFWVADMVTICVGIVATVRALLPIWRLRNFRPENCTFEILWRRKWRVKRVQNWHIYDCKIASYSDTIFIHISLHSSHNRDFFIFAKILRLLCGLRYALLTTEKNIRGMMSHIKSMCRFWYSYEGTWWPYELCAFHAVIIYRAVSKRHRRIKSNYLKNIEYISRDSGATRSIKASPCLKGCIPSTKYVEYSIHRAKVIIWCFKV